MEDSEVIPRINSSMFKEFNGKTVRVVGKVLSTVSILKIILYFIIHLYSINFLNFIPKIGINFVFNFYFILYLSIIYVQSFLK